MKKCVTCGEAKLFSEFHRSKVNADGLHKQCKSCRKQESKTAYTKNKNAISARAKIRYAANRKKVIEAAKSYVARNKEQVAQRQASYYQKNKEHRQQYRRAHYKQNAEKYLSAEARRRCLMNQLPGWADVGRIEELYRWARTLSSQTGVQHHVDHIVPLQNKRVCGLHVQDNLRVVTAAVNLAKKNRFEEERL